MKLRIGRYLRMYQALVRFSISRSLEFRFDFFFRFFMDVVWYSVTIGFFKILYLHTPNLGGWREDQTLLFLSLALILDGVYMTVFARNMWSIPELINKGELDYLLVRPAHPLFLPLLQRFEVASLLNVMVGIGVFVWAVQNYQEPFGVLNLVFCLLLLGVGILMYVCLQLFSVLPVFWTHSNFGFHMLSQALSSILERPEVIFRGLTHFVLVTALPFLVITSFPARAFFGDLGLLDVLHMLFLFLALMLAVHLVWNAGLRVYSSASS